MKKKNTNNTPKITILGLGAMGTSFANAFLEKGHSITVWNRTASKADPLIAKGAVKAETLSKSIISGDLIIICVSSYNDVYKILKPVITELSGKTLINLSSGTYHQANEMARWVESKNIQYIDGAAMSGVLRVGLPEALFLYSGDNKAFKINRSTLMALGKTEYLGTDPGFTSFYDMALFGMAWGTLAGFYHAVALAKKNQVDAQTFAAIAANHLPFLGSLIKEHAVQIDSNNYPNDDGALDIHAAAMEHLVQSSRDQGISTRFPHFIKTLLDQGVSSGYGNDGISRMIDVFKKI